FESLIKAGAFDSLSLGDPGLAPLATQALRPRLMASVDAVCEHGARMQRDRDEGQAQLFGELHQAEADVPAVQSLPDAAPWSDSEQLAFEKETLGLYWSGHP